ncbi:MAG: hypothetical protein GY774_06345, partial [Planctomycetes bacterium]|nr:hypothetical protein [Planctomycetota bacterium]
MPIAHLITSGFNVIFLTLTPVERWNAAGKHDSGLNLHWFILIAAAALIIMIAMLIMASYNRIMRERKLSGKLFFDYAEQRGLSGRERQILLNIALKAGIKRKQAIFSMAGA